MAERGFDLVVVGAGTAGAATAMHCARRGLSVALLDCRPLASAGGRWANAVAGWTFDRAGVRRPEGDELLGAGSVVHLIAGDRQVVTRCEDLLEVDMRQLVARLQLAAQAAGATLYPQTRVERWDGRALHTTAGAFEPRWVADASGYAGAQLIGRHVRATDVCSAAQQVRTVRDPAGARDFYARHGADEGAAISFVGVAGGFSTLGLRFEGDRVGILAGSIPANGHPSGPELLRRFVGDNAWISDRVLFGGARAIPLGRPNDLLADDRVAILGDAAGQVFSAHGSGVGHGLLAARQLADALVRGEGPRGYGVTFQRRLGGVLAAFDLFRRLSQTLTTQELEQLIDGRLMSAHTIRLALSLGVELPSPAALLRAVVGALRQPQLGVRLGAVVGKMGLLLALYARYPKEPGRLPVWTRRVERLY